MEPLFFQLATLLENNPIAVVFFRVLSILSEQLFLEHLRTNTFDSCSGRYSVKNFRELVGL